MGQRTFLHAPALDSHWLEDLADGTPMAEKNDQRSATQSYLYYTCA